MRFVATIALTLALGSVIATPSAAQTGPKGSIAQSFNACVDLARQRGWTDSDLDGNRAGARNFVIRCMQGGKARAQKPKTKR